MKPAQRLKRAACLAGWLILAFAAPCRTAEPAASAREQAPELDAGGFSVNIPDTAERESPVQGPNLLSNGGFEEVDAGTKLPRNWSRDFYVYADPQDLDRKTALLKELAPQTRWGVSQDRPHSGKICAFLGNPRAMRGKRDAEAFPFAALFSTSIKLAAARQDVKYALSLFHRGRTEADIAGRWGNKARVIVCFLDQDGKQTREFVQFAFAPKEEWNKVFSDFVVPRSTRSLAITLFLDGYGEVSFDDVDLRRVAMDKGLTARLMPAYFIDNLFCLSSGDPGMMVFSIYDELGTERRNPQIVVELPKSVHLMGTHAQTRLLRSEPLKREGADAIQYRFDLSYTHFISKSCFEHWHRFCMAVKTDLAPGPARYPVRYWIEDGDYRGKAVESALQVVPAIKPAAAPSRFETAAMFINVPFHDSGEEAAIGEFAAFYRRMGFNAAYVDSCLPFSRELANRNIRRYGQPPGGLGNGYQLSGEIPASARFQMVDGSYYDGICPVEVYRKGPYFQKAIKEPLRKLIVIDRQTDHIMPNWEPYMYFFKGCFCPRCKEEFIKFSKLPRETVDKAWPADVIKDHRDLWARFRSWQHGRLVVAMEETVSGLGKEAGVESHFVPAVAYNLFLAGWEKEEGNRQISVLDFADQLPVLAPWAPYIQDLLGKPYQYIPGKHLALHAGASGVREFLDGQFPADKRPRIIAYVMLAPFAYFKQPEAVQFDYLTYFLDGYQGAFLYFFPEGYDARYWKAMARTHTLISQFEPYVMSGVRKADHEIKPETPLAEATEGSLQECTLYDDAKKDQWKHASLLQSWEYQRQGKRLIAVADFWQQGECFFRLTPKGLVAAQRYVLSEPAEGRVYANPKAEIAWSGEDLQKGLLLHVGAMRQVFFVLQPYEEGKTYGATTILPRQMRSALEQRLPGIRKAFEREKGPAASRPKEESGDGSSWKTIEKQGLTCEPALLPTKGKTGLLLASPHQELLVDPAGGGRIISWQVKGRQYAHAEGVFGLMLDGFWYPRDSAIQITGPFRVLSQEATDCGIRVVLERKLGQEANRLEGLTVTKTIEVPFAMAAFRVQTRITNTTEWDKEFSHRYHNMPSPLELHAGKDGWADMTDQGKPVRFKRLFALQMFRYTPAPYDQQVLEASPMDKTRPISEPRLTLGCDWLPAVVRLELDPKNLLAVSFWDEGGLKCATTEPIHRRVVLKPGESWQTQAQWRVPAEGKGEEGKRGNGQSVTAKWLQT
jgi:hypothetical protein